MNLSYTKILEANNVLESPRLILRPFTLMDSEAVFEYASDLLVTKYLTWEAIPSKEKAESIIENLYMKQKGIYAIELKEEKKCIGCIDIRVDSYSNTASFGYVLNKNYWNKGYMTEALKVILKLAFDDIKVAMVEATHYLGNEGSGRVMEKCGMHNVGTGHKEVYVKGRYYDVKHYVILKEEYYKLYK